MNAQTAIAWTDVSWNPVRGCSRVSEGCRNCYAERQAARYQKPGEPYHGLVASTPDGPRWTGRLALASENTITKPLHWRKPRRVFVNSMSDLFHESLTDAQIKSVFDVMAATPQHQYQVLTKRPVRMQDFCRRLRLITPDELAHLDAPACSLGPGGRAVCGPRPLPNVWLGVSVEDQPSADARIPVLLDTPAALRFVSCEPLLGPVDLRMLGPDGAPTAGMDVLAGWQPPDHEETLSERFFQPLDWVIVGGESGPGARSCQVEWIESIRHDCLGADVPCFVKQLGAYPRPGGRGWDRGARWVYVPPDGPAPATAAVTARGDRAVAKGCGYVINDRKGAEPSEWPEHLRVQQWPEPRHVAENTEVGNTD